MVLRDVVRTSGIRWLNVTARKIFSMTDWKVGREALLKPPELEDPPYSAMKH